MTRREVARRVLVWALAGGTFAAMIWLALVGQWTSLLGFSMFAVVGAVILQSRPGNGIGWYLIAVGIANALIFWTLVSPTSDLPVAVESAVNAGAGAFWILLFAIGSVFPTGRPQTTLGVVATISLTVAAALSALTALFDPATELASGRPNPFGVDGIAGVIAVGWGAATTGWMLAAIAIVVDLALRWRAASGVERLQYRWFVYSLACLLAIVGVAVLVVPFARGTLVDSVLFVFATLSFNLLPISIGIAVTRHGLYEIDRVVSRTVAYAAVTAVTVAVYALVVTSTTWLAPQLPSVGVAVATLAAAAVFLPALRGVQRIIDRRFDREHYNAERVVETFGEQLRTQVDPEATSEDLLKAVERTLQPATAGLWRQEVQR